MSGRGKDLDNGLGVSVYSSLLPEDGISSYSPLSSFSLRSLVKRLVAMDLATLLLVGFQGFLLALSKIRNEVW
jgi:hypothetical protein